MVKFPAPTQRLGFRWNLITAFNIGVFGLTLLFRDREPNDCLVVCSNAQHPREQSQLVGFHTIHVYHGQQDPASSLKESCDDCEYPYGSQVHQDITVLEISRELDLLLKRNQNKFFVDLAANDAARLSNTVELEAEGWEGLCIEPNPEYWYRLAYRTCTVIGSFVGGINDGAFVNVSLRNGVFGGIVDDKMDNKPKKGENVEKRSTISIKSLFRNFDVPTEIEYLSLDVEGAEDAIFEHFPFDDFTINILTVERPSVELQSRLRSHGYDFLRMLVNFGETLWVHQSVLKTVSRAKLDDIVRKNHPPQPKNGIIYNMATGKLENI